jgi:nicotinamide-nucleotide amidase
LYRRADRRPADRDPGLSDVVERGFVTYSNAAKTEQLGVPAVSILHGAVSEPVARAMAEGALASRADRPCR